MISHNKKKPLFYMLLFGALIMEILLIVFFLKGEVSIISFILIGISNLFVMISSIINIRKILDNKK